MRLTVLAILVALQPVSAPQDALVVERLRIGPVSIGASAEEIYTAFRDRARLIDLKLEGHLSPALEITLFGSQLVASLVAEIGPADNKLVVTRIHVIDPSLRTREGIGVGSTYEELSSRYSVDWVGSGEGRFIARVKPSASAFSSIPPVRCRLDPSANQARCRKTFESSARVQISDADWIPGTRRYKHGRAVGSRPPTLTSRS
jgi:hypothetical protein